MNTIKKLLLLVVLLGGIGPSFATNEVMRDDPRRPVDKISNDLGIQPEQFRQCFSNVSPAPAGQRPGSDRTHANKAVLLSCLQKANPAITNESLDTVMDRYRPGGREAQMPPGKS
jgi:hypothetical protein